jgi:hypothetical protein
MKNHLKKLTLFVLSQTNPKINNFFRLLVVAIIFLTTMSFTPSADALNKDPNLPQMVHLYPQRCNSSWVQNYSQTGSIRVWTHNMKFEWCYNGGFVTIVRNQIQWVDFNFSFPGSSYSTANSSITVGSSTDGSKIITGQTTVTSCIVILPWGCKTQTSIIRFRLMKDGRAFRE